MYLGIFYNKSLYFKTADKAEHEGHFRWYCALVVHVPGTWDRGRPCSSQLIYPLWHRPYNISNTKQLVVDLRKEGKDTHLSTSVELR